MVHPYEAEVRTKSVPAAAHLICLGIEPTKVITGADGKKVICFPPSARSMYNGFFEAKAHIDQMLEAGDEARA